MSDQPYPLAVTLMCITGVTLVFRSCIKYLDVIHNPNVVSEEDVEGARRDVEEARALLNRLVIQLLPVLHLVAPDSAPRPSLSNLAATSASTRAVDSLAMANVMETRLALFESRLLETTGAATERKNETNETKSALLRVEADLRAAEQEYKHKIAELELSAKNARGEFQIQATSDKQKLEGLHAEHVDAMKAIARANDVALDALRSENKESNDTTQVHVEEAVHKYHDLLSSKFDDLQGVTKRENEELKKENSNFRVQLEQFKTTHVELVAASSELVSSKREHARAIADLSESRDALAEERDQLVSELRDAREKVARETREREEKRETERVLAANDMQDLQEKLSSMSKEMEEVKSTRAAQAMELANTAKAAKAAQAVKETKKIPAKMSKAESKKPTNAAASRPEKQEEQEEQEEQEVAVERAKETRRRRGESFTNPFQRL